ncbi:flagellar hook-length control protein FliK [Colwellia sp. MEBiC06753]
MPQVKILSIDLMQATDNSADVSGRNLNANSKQSKDNSQFSRLVDEQLNERDASYRKYDNSANNSANSSNNASDNRSSRAGNSRQDNADNKNDSSVTGSGKTSDDNIEQGALAAKERASDEGVAAEANGSQQEQNNQASASSDSEISDEHQLPNERAVIDEAVTEGANQDSSEFMALLMKSETMLKKMADGEFKQQMENSFDQNSLTQVIKAQLAGENLDSTDEQLVDGEASTQTQVAAANEKQIVAKAEGESLTEEEQMLAALSVKATGDGTAAGEDAGLTEQALVNSKLSSTVEKGVPAQAHDSNQDSKAEQQVLADGVNEEITIANQQSDKVTGEALLKQQASDLGQVSEKVTLASQASEQALSANSSLNNSQANSEANPLVDDDKLTTLPKSAEQTASIRLADVLPHQVKSDSAKPEEHKVNTATATLMAEHVSTDEQASEQDVSDEQNHAKQNAQQTSTPLTGSAESVINTGARTTFADSLAAAGVQSATDEAVALDQKAIQQHLDSVAGKVTQSNVEMKKAQQIQLETINIYRRDFANAVKDKVMVMVNQKLQQVDIQLDPPELGNVHVRLNLQGEQAAVSFTVQNQQAKEALEQQMGKLRDMLQESGVDVGDANVAQQQQNQQSEGFGQGHQQGGQQLTDGNVAPETIAQLVKPSATGVDFYA